MFVYVCLIGLIILLNFILNKKNYIIAVSVLLILCAGLRHPEMGLGDVEKIYLPLFEQSRDLTIIDIFAQFSLNNGIGNMLLMKLFTSLNLPYQLFLAFCSAVFVIASEKLVFKYSKDVLLSQIILLSSAYFFSFAVIRQYMALSFLLFSMPYLFSRKLIKFTLTIIIGALFHYTVLVAWLLYPLIRIFKSNILIIAVIVSGLLFGLVFQSVVINVIGLFYPKIYDYISYGIYQTGGKLSLIWLLILFVSICIYFFNLRNGSDKSSRCGQKVLSSTYELTLVLSVGIMAYAFSAIVVEFYRFSQYFTIINIILLPNLISQVNNKSLKIFLKISAIVLFLIYMTLSTLNNLNCLHYQFFWQ